MPENRHLKKANRLETRAKAREKIHELTEARLIAESRLTSSIQGKRERLRAKFPVPLRWAIPKISYRRAFLEIPVNRAGMSVLEYLKFHFDDRIQTLENLIDLCERSSGEHVLLRAADERELYNPSDPRHGNLPFPESKRTFALLKPDALENKLEEKILKIIQDHGFQIIRAKTIPRPSHQKVEAHFADLRAKNQEAYGRNARTLQNGPVVILDLFLKSEGDAVKTLRDLAGPTNPSENKPGTIRSLSRDSIPSATAENRGLRNLIHASDSTESVERELEIWFG